jgi:hypothetical protein
MISKILNQIVLALSLLIWFLLLPVSVVAQEEESSEKWAPLAVKEVVESHDQTLILKGGDLMVRQQIVKAAKLFVLRWGRERGLGDAWWEDKQEYQQAVDELLRIGDQIMLEKFESGAWLTNIWTEYTAKNFTGEQASAIAEHFKTEYGMVQRRLMEWYLGETTLFYYTFTDRWDYRLEETRKQLEALQKEARTRVPNDKLSWKAGEKEAYTFIACSPDSEYCPGVKYWKMLAIPMMGAVFRYMEDITREIKAAMEARRDLVEPYFLAFERSQASQ